MHPSASSVDISIAVLSWINEELRGSIDFEDDRAPIRTIYWQQQAVRVLAAGLSGFCLLVLQTWT